MGRERFECGSSKTGSMKMTQKFDHVVYWFGVDFEQKDTPCRCRPDGLSSARNEQRCFYFMLLIFVLQFSHLFPAPALVMCCMMIFSDSCLRATSFPWTVGQLTRPPRCSRLKLRNLSESKAALLDYVSRMAARMHQLFMS